MLSMEVLTVSDARDLLSYGITSCYQPAPIGCSKSYCSTSAHIELCHCALTCMDYANLCHEFTSRCKSDWTQYQLISADI